MKKISISLLIIIAGVVLSCGKEDDIVDCFGQSLLLNVHHRTDVDNSKKINFNVTYSGSESLDGTVKWDFGDGSSTQTVNGVTTSHIYTNAGPYQAKATVTINGASCSYDLKESVTVQ